MVKAATKRFILQTEISISNLQVVTYSAAFTLAAGMLRRLLMKELEREMIIRTTLTDEQRGLHGAEKENVPGSAELLFSFLKEQPQQKHTLTAGRCSLLSFLRYRSLCYLRGGSPHRTAGVERNIPYKHTNCLICKRPSRLSETRTSSSPYLSNASIFLR